MNEKKERRGVRLAEKLSLESYDYPLPDERIAKFPLEKRDECRLLCYDKGETPITDAVFKELPELLSPDSLLIRNNSRVIHARILMKKPGGAKIEIFCLSPIAPSSYDESLSSTNGTTWRCLIGNAKKWHQETLEKSVTLPDGKEICLKATRDTQDPFAVKFSYNAEGLGFGEVLDAIGTLPIPPYLGRDTEDSDLSDYQTIYAVKDGSVAAPTAGLHFTDEVDNALQKRGITLSEVTLHVGAGTFLPVKGNDIAAHQMHSEICCVTRDTLEAILHHQGRIVAVGTTSVRTIESLYYLAQNHFDEIGNSPTSEHFLPHIGQWEAYEGDREEEFELIRKLLQKMEGTGLHSLYFSTALFIIPGYRYHYISRLITNFHQPKSTLLLMISAFIGDDWQGIYHHALKEGYRFLSYGDACLLSARNQKD